MDLMALRRRIIMTNSYNTKIPSEYEEADYLIHIGHQCRVDTGVPGNDSTLQFDVEFRWTQVQQNYGAVFGNYASESASKCWRLILPDVSQYPNACLLYATLGNTNATKSKSVWPIGSQSNPSSTLNLKTYVHMEYGSCTVTCNDVTRTYTAPDDSSSDNSTNIAIGASNPTSSGYNNNRLEIFSFKITKQGKLIRNYVPCVRKADSKAGYYDLVNRSFHLSDGDSLLQAGYDT